MGSLTLVKIVTLVGILLLCVGVGYRTGSTVADNKHLSVEKEATKKAVEQVKEAQEIDQQVIEHRAEAVKVVTRPVTKVQREIIKLPVRDCGFTNDERVSINVAYCANFPDAASCLHDPLPASGGITRSGG